MSFKYLHETSPGMFYLDHRLNHSVRAMFCAMASRMPGGGITARYTQIVEVLAEGLWEEDVKAAPDYSPSRGLPCTWDEFRTRTDLDAGVIRSYLERAEEILCAEEVHPRVQEFFDTFVLQYGHCYDDQTEVLCQDVESGQVMWVFWKDAVRWNQSTTPAGSGEVRLRLAAFDLATDSVRFEEPLAWVVKPYTGEMYRVRKERGNIDLLVTPEHTMLVSKRVYVGGGRADAAYKWSSWHGVKAQDVADKTTYRYKRGASRLADVHEITLAEDPWGLSLKNLNAFGRLCGFFVGDGYAGGKQAGYLSFNIRKEREQAFLATIESDLGLKVQRSKSGACHVHLEGARDWARQFFYHPTATVPSGKPAKDIPTWVMLAPEPFIRGFFEGLHNSDGSTVTDESWSFANSSDTVMDKLQILGTLWGCPVSVRGPYQEGGSKIAFVSGPKCKEPVINRNSKEDGWEDYDGMVYCATVSTGFLVVRRNHATMISGNSSIMELTGSPSVYTEGISWYTAYLLFDSPLCSGQEFSTRAVRHKDWPLAREVAGDPRFQELHNLWMDIFEAEVGAWKDFFSDANNRAAYGIKDKEPFRPALDRARWAIPGTIATGCAHTGHLRERARVLRDGYLLAQKSGSSAAVQTWEDIRKTYAQAAPALAGMGLREAVYDEGNDRLPVHLGTLSATTSNNPEVVTTLFMTGEAEQILALPPRKKGQKAYLDPWYNKLAQVKVSIRCSLAVARDWHRHRTMYPWYVQPVMTEAGSLTIHPSYEVKSEFGKANIERALALSTRMVDDFVDAGDNYSAMHCLPLGTQMEMTGQAGLRDFVYSMELRRDAHGANFEYQAQAEQAVNQLRDELQEIITDLPDHLGL